MNIIEALCLLDADPALYATHPGMQDALDARSVGYVVLIRDGSLRYGHTKQDRLRCASLDKNDILRDDWQVLRRLI